MKILCIAIGIAACLWSDVVAARSFDFKFLKSNGASSGKGQKTFTEKTKYSIFQVKIGAAGKKDSMVRQAKLG